jgi:hypothetical protein
MNKELFLEALHTLIWSWGSDAPPEAYWAANAFLDYFEAVNNIKLDICFEEPCEENDWESNYGKVIERIKQL